jgi:hypothetical protein
MACVTCGWQCSAHVGVGCVGEKLRVISVKPAALFAATTPQCVRGGVLSVLWCWGGSESQETLQLLPSVEEFEPAGWLVLVVWPFDLCSSAYNICHAVRLVAGQNTAELTA